MLHRRILELEQAFRQNWRSFKPDSYAYYVEQLEPDQRLELLARLLSVELEFAFQPPSCPIAGGPIPPYHSAAPTACRDSPIVDNETRGETDDIAAEPVRSDRHAGQDLSGNSDDCDDECDQRVKPCVPLFLLRFPELARRSELVVRLIVLEYALRLRHDPCPPDPESYLPLCEQSRDQLIRLLELTENKIPAGRTAPPPVGPVGRSDSTIKEASLSASITLDPLPLHLGCFLLVRMLGRGGMGYVHAAMDLRSTAQVAVKVMRRVDAWSIYRFIEEFRWLSQLNHPHLVKLYDAFCEGDIRYFSMELVEGKMIRHWFRHGTQRSQSHWNELGDVLGQLASAVEYLHENQVVHCDLKCSNMMITAGRRAVLLDLGLAIRAGQNNRLVGTLQYMAPEIIQGGAASYASDWYSFGVMIFEVLTDTFPPIHIEPSQSGGQDTAYHLDIDQVRHALRECPDGLASLCIDLMHSDPAQRPSGSEVIERLSGNRKCLTVGRPTQLCWGRERELNALNQATGLPIENAGRSRLHGDDALDALSSDDWLASNGQASLVILQGEIGSGKTTLLNRWLETLPVHDRLLLSVRCYRQDHTPLRLLNAIVQELTVAVPRLSSACWEQALEKLSDEICVLFPQIQQLLPSQKVKPARNSATHNACDPAAQAASLEALLQWLLCLGQRRRVIICVDDAHWGDLESLTTLKRLLNHSTGFNGALILIDESKTRCLDDVFYNASGGPGTRRRANGESESEPVSSGKLAYSTLHIGLASLTQTTCRNLLHYWSKNAAVPLDSAVADEIAQRSCGNPFLLKEIFRVYVHYVTTQDATAKDWLSKDPACPASRRFSMLSQTAENILQYLAVAADALSFHQLQMVSRIVPDELQRILNWLVDQGWITSAPNAQDSDIEIPHENFRSAILYSIPQERLHRRHYRLARVLSCETPPVWARIGNHYWEAEHFREASACYMEAARQAHAQGKWVEALNFLQRAEHPEAQRTDTERLYVMRLKADCLAAAGHSQAAAELYDRLPR